LPQILALPVQYTIRKFLPEEADAYKAIRLEALQTAPGNFGNSYAKELAFDDAVWLERLNNPNSACFGLFADEELIGLTGIFHDPNQPGEAYMTQSFIRAEHRGKRLSRMFYETRIAWAIEKGLTCLLIGHRKSNIASYAANQAFGFKYSHSESRIWPDGVEEEMCYYKLLLEKQ
jgi:RimJ/RimL family protein N-acetyltransferase